MNEGLIIAVGIAMRIPRLILCFSFPLFRQHKWGIEACNRFAELTWVAQWKVLVAKVRGYKERALSYGRSRREGSPIPRVDLFEKNEDTVSLTRFITNEAENQLF